MPHRLSKPSSPLALLALALLLTRGLGGQTVPRRQFPLGSLTTSTILWNLDSACTAGALAACDTMGMHYYAVKDKKGRQRAAELWERTCTAGGIGACANLSLAYDDGEGVHRDRRKALALARQACDSGSAPACVGVASMLSDGRAGPKDPAAGAAMMEQACTMGDLYACMNMGYRALDGSFGVTRDTSRARVFLARACTVAVVNHPYPWYRWAATEACKTSYDIGPPAAN